MSSRSLARCFLLSSVLLACGSHSADHGASTTTGDAGAGDAGTSDARPTDASSTHERTGAGDAADTLDSGQQPEGGAPDCPIPSTATALSGCAALYVECISVAIDCTCTSTQYQMLCQPTAVPPSALGCSAQPGASPQAPAYCCPCGSDDGGTAVDAGSRM